MNLNVLKQRFDALNLQEKVVYSPSQLWLLFNSRSDEEYNDTLAVAMEENLLHQEQGDLFVYSHATVPKRQICFALVEAFARGDFFYVSLEYALSQWGVISQVPFVLTMSTTGPDAWFSSDRYGEYEFVHIDMDVGKILRNRDVIVYPDRLKLAKPNLALEDLKMVGRSLELVNMEDYEEAMKEAQAMPL